MKRSIVAAGLLLSALAPSAFAQDGGIRVSPGGPGGGGFQIQGLPGMSGIAASRALVGLLRRADVQSALRIDLKQRQALADLLDSKTGAPIRISATRDQNTSPEDLQKQIQDQIANMQSDTEKRLKETLKPEQFDRLMELDLQWRGILALADAKTAKRLNISPEHRNEINTINGEYQNKKGRVMMDLAQKQIDDSAGQRRVMVRMDANPKELANPLSPQYKELAAAKKEAEEKAIKVLSAEERESFKKAQGSEFAFRIDIPGNRF